MMSRALERIRFERHRWLARVRPVVGLPRLLISSAVAHRVHAGRDRVLVCLSRNRRLVGTALVGGLISGGCLLWWAQGASEQEAVTSPAAPVIEVPSASAHANAAPAAVPMPPNDALPQTGFANKYLVRHDGPAAASPQSTDALRGAWLTGTIEDIAPAPVTRAAHFVEGFPSRQ